MLSSLSLNNVALIKSQTVEFKKGFNCLLGQSGAGKSIIIDALSFLLGAKSDKNLIRSGETFMRVDAVFSDLSDEVKSFLQALEIDFDEEIIITRTLNLEGKSSIKIDGIPFGTKMLKDFSAMLADFCGQHDSVGLLNVSNHLGLLDRFSGNVLETVKKNVGAKYDELKNIENKIASLGGNEFERTRTKELLSYQINEIEKASLEVGETESLKERFDFISSSEKIFQKVGSVLNKLDGQRDNVCALLFDSKSDLASVSKFTEIEQCRTRIENAYYEIKDVVDVLEEVKQNTDFDPKELDRIDGRLDLIKSLSKKYGKSIVDILDFKQACVAQLEELQNSEIMLEKLQKEQSIVVHQLEDYAKELSTLRKSFAKVLEEQIKNQLDDLEMKGTEFKVVFEEVAFTRKGMDSVKFMFSANKGQDIKDLHKTASGGELSRLLLAFKNVLLDKERVQTVVFDEIDSGISGHTAGRLAEKLANISKFTQIICITHTPVVAAKADEFLLVEKNVQENSTCTTVKSLNNEMAVVEIAKLIDGGIELSDTAIEHAKKLFARV